MNVPENATEYECWRALVIGHLKVFNETGCRKALNRAQVAAEIVEQLLAEKG